ncbi:MAG TPA: HAMP domain-containing sensor histidine kinase [Gemmataceae bacterium]|jgi:signal transduction histidine kinase|nr:HAMP domain-containing sensor histidine kinase [Gemmataceae bacterium]
MAEPVAVPWWKYVRALGPVVLFWAALVVWLAYLLAERSRMGPENDEANLHEWIDEARSFRKTVPELAREYVYRLDIYNGDADAPEVQLKAQEIAEQLKAMADPIRRYEGQLPMFIVIYRLEVRFPARPAAAAIVWRSPAPRPKEENQSHVRHLYHAAGADAVIYVEYRVHAFSKLQRDETQRQDLLWLVAGVVLGGSLLALVWVWMFLRRERQREFAQVEAERAREHAEVLMLAAKVEAQEAERAAADAEKANLEMRSQLYASIGIMAGSYAHNIKNLLVRPNDLISRCLEADGMSNDQAHMLTEVKATLGTVTERLQMILRTVRRDPTRAEMTTLDLNDLIRETGATWGTIGREKWKLTVSAAPAAEPLRIRGDLSHLQQAVENLVFNARDATFEMRNHVRDAARAERDPAKRKQALIDAAAWRGEVTVAGRREGGEVVLGVRDNGIGMTPEVRAKCLETHFTTKRDNALYEGYNAGMGLGLSFVAVVLEHHGATLEVESEPFRGALFRIRFPAA